VATVWATTVTATTAAPIYARLLVAVVSIVTVGANWVVAVCDHSTRSAPSIRRSGAASRSAAAAAYFVLDDHLLFGFLVRLVLLI
jgi:hypothetical protein